MSESYVTTDKPFLVTMGYAPIPTHVLKPREFGPLSSAKKLVEYIKLHKDGMLREVHCLDEMDYVRVMGAFEMPEGSLWFMRVEKKHPDGLSSKELRWEAGIRQ